MARIDLKTSQIGSFGTGDLQLQNGVAMDATLRLVTDAVNTASPLKLSTTLVQTTSTLKITTSDNPYIDAEDNSGNNRFTVGRDPASQQVNVDFASNPTGSTTAVGAIRTYRDGVNLSEAMTFIEDGSIGVGTTAPIGLLDLFKSAAATRLAIRGDAGQNRLISYRTGAVQRFGLYVNNTAESGSNVGSDFAVRAYNDAGTLLSTPLFIKRSTGNVAINTITGTAKLQVVGSGTTSATTSFLVQNSAGTTSLEITDSNLLCLGGTTSSFPAIKRNGTAIDFRLADDSGFATINANSIGIGTQVTIAQNTGTSSWNTPLGNVTGNVGTLAVFQLNMGSDVSTSSTSNYFNVTKTISPNTGSANFNNLICEYTINASGVQTGTATGILLNATETNLNGMTHNLMDLKVGGSSKFQVNNVGAISIGNTVANAVAIASTHKVTVVIGGTTYYLLATNI